MTVSAAVVVMEIDVDCVVIRLAGEHDLSTAVALSETMAHASALDDTDVVVDLSAVEFCERGNDRRSCPGPRIPAAAIAVVDAAIAVDTRPAGPRPVWTRL